MALAAQTTASMSAVQPSFATIALQSQHRHSAAASQRFFPRQSRCIPTPPHVRKSHLFSSKIWSINLGPAVSYAQTAYATTASRMSQTLLSCSPVSLFKPLVAGRYSFFNPLVRTPPRYSITSVLPAPFRRRGISDRADAFRCLASTTVAQSLPTPAASTYAPSDAGDSVSTLRPEANAHFFTSVPASPRLLPMRQPVTLFISALPARVGLPEVAPEDFRLLTLTLSDLRALAERQNEQLLLVHDVRTTLAAHGLWPAFDAGEPVRDARFEGVGYGTGRGSGYVVSFDDDVSIEHVERILRPLLGTRLVSTREADAQYVPLGAVHLYGPSPM